MSIYTQVCQMAKEVRNVFRGEYPSFVFHSNPKEVDFIPIFAYHRVEPVEFESDLRFLLKNGYRTVTGDEYLRWLNGENGSWKKCVLLTFDDGMSSVFTHGLPLLKKYGMHALVFLVAGYLREYAKEGEPCCRDEHWNPLLSWEEIVQMQSSGCFSFGSHTSFHHPIFVSDDLVDFGNPKYNSMLFDFPIEKGAELEIIENDSKKNWGIPIYRHKHFMQAKQIYSNEFARAACTDYVRRTDGISFFKDSAWRQELTEVATRHKSKGRMLKPSEISELILADLVESKKAIEKRVDSEIQHLCYPYGAGSELSIRLSKNAGFKTNVWQTLPYQSRNYVGCDPFRLVRIKKDFLKRLPGVNRISLAGIYHKKMMRRFRGNPYF